MTRTVRTAAGALAAALLTVAMAVTATPAQAAVWSSSDRWGTWSSGGYTLYNNIWGSGHGAQTIWADSPGNWASGPTTRTPAASRPTRTPPAS